MGVNMFSKKLKQFRKKGQAELEMVLKWIIYLAIAIAAGFGIRAIVVKATS